MSTNKDGGPAFPIPTSESSHEWNACQFGMTLRDYFAAKAMHAFIAEPCWEEGCGLRPMFSRHSGENDCELDGIAKSSYRMADAMIKASEAR